jgi:hypothetical protein
MDMLHVFWLVLTTVLSSESSIILVQDRYKHVLSSSILTTAIITIGSHRSGNWLEIWWTCLIMSSFPQRWATRTLRTTVLSFILVRDWLSVTRAFCCYCNCLLSPIRYWARNMADLSLEWVDFGLVLTAVLSLVLVQDTCTFCQTASWGQQLHLSAIAIADTVPTICRRGILLTVYLRFMG